MKESILEIIAKEPKYRQDQLYKAMFNPAVKGYEGISTFPLELRKTLTAYPWLSVKQKLILKSKIDQTEKALLELADGLCIETVLMARESKKDDEDEDEDRKKKVKLRRTICISSQVGCGMKCVFCATGAQGFRRNLSILEIIDQYRFWQNHLGGGKESIGNIVVMGQGEPLLNYDAIKSAINIILKNTDIPPSKITISTVGQKESMEKILTDKDFPPVRLAISLHSAVEKTRVEIVPSSQEGFLDFLVKWSEKYHKTLGSRSHFISLEYVMLRGINDNETHLKALISLARKMGRIKINLMPWNPIVIASPSACPAKPCCALPEPCAEEGRSGEGVAIPLLETRLPRRGLLTMTRQLTGSPDIIIKQCQNTLMKSGFTCTVRHSQGADIAAACGQLSTII